MLHAQFRPRNPLARLLGGVLGILAVAAVLTLGLFALAALIVGGGMLWLYRALRKPRRVAPPPASPPPPGIIDGEFIVISTRPDHSPQR